MKPTIRLLRFIPVTAPDKWPNLFSNWKSADSIRKDLGKGIRFTYFDCGIRRVDPQTLKGNFDSHELLFNVDQRCDGITGSFGKEVFVRCVAKRERILHEKAIAGSAAIFAKRRARRRIVGNLQTELLARACFNDHAVGRLRS